MMNKSEFAALADEYVKLQEESISDGGGGIHFSDPRGDVFVPPLPAPLVSEVAAHTERLVESVDRLYLVDNNILNIISEELPAFFSGDKSAEDIAHIIQNRVGIYLSELG